MRNRWVWYCPNGSLEHLMLAEMGWKVDRNVLVGLDFWVCLTKPKETEKECHEE